MLARDGKLGLDDDVRAFLPELPPFDPPIRVRHCLYHTCGLTDWLVALEFAGPTEDNHSVSCAYRTIAALVRRGASIPNATTRRSIGRAP